MHMSFKYKSHLMCFEVVRWLYKSYDFIIFLFLNFLLSAIPSPFPMMTVYILEEC
jgi:hypothetical protein